MYVCTASTHVCDGHKFQSFWIKLVLFVISDHCNGPCHNYSYMRQWNPDVSYSHTPCPISLKDFKSCVKRVIVHYSHVALPHIAIGKITICTTWAVYICVFTWFVEQQYYYMGGTHHYITPHACVCQAHYALFLPITLTSHAIPTSTSMSCASKNVCECFQHQLSHAWRTCYATCG